MQHDHLIQLIQFINKYYTSGACYGGKCGGGSGFLKYYFTAVPAGEMKITARVGGGGSVGWYPGGTSYVWLNNSKTIEAKGGATGGGGNERTHVGGHGYSGGGDFYDLDNTLIYNNGGSNGGKGGGHSGGGGTGENIAAYSFDNFRLSPGQGGQFHHRWYDDIMLNYGGGGGGVLVDNNGPTAGSHQGKGYGGGGGPHGGDGLPGIILMEVFES